LVQRSPPVGFSGPGAVSGGVDQLRGVADNAEGGKFDEFDSTGEEAFKAGSKIAFTVQPNADGFLYLVEEGTGPAGPKKWSALFPNPLDNNKSAQVTAGRVQSITPMKLDDNPGDEVIHIVWSKEPLTDLETLFAGEIAENIDGVFSDPAQQTVLTGFFHRNSTSPAERTFVNGAEPRVVLKAQGDLLIGSLILKHRSYGR